MNRSPRMHLERLEDRITPDATATLPPPAPPATTLPDQVVVTPPPTTTITVPTVQQMLDALNAYLASLPPPGSGGSTGLGTGLGGGSSGN